MPPFIRDLTTVRSRFATLFAPAATAALVVLVGPGLVPTSMPGDGDAVPGWRAAAQERPVAADSLGYGVQTGDQVTLDFYSSAGAEVAVIAGTRIVDREGRLFLPFVGSVRVLGLDAEAIRNHLEELYSSFYTDPVIDVTVELRVNVTGAVTRPGNYFMAPSSTIVDALALAGGAGLDVAVVTSQIPADPSAVRLIRNGETYVLDLRPDEANDDVLNMLIESGDWLFVPPRGRSRLREELTFWGSVVSFVTGIVALAVLVS